MTRLWATYRQLRRGEPFEVKRVRAVDSFQALVVIACCSGPYLTGFEKQLAWFFFGLLVVILFSTMAAYVVGAGEILVSLFGLPLWAGKLLFFVELINGLCSNGEMPTSISGRSSKR